MVLRYIMYLWFYRWRHFFIPWVLWADGQAPHCVAYQYQWTWLLAECGPLQPTAGLLAQWADFLGHRPGWVLAVWWLDSSGAGDGGAYLPCACFMLVVSCTLGWRLLSMIALLCGCNKICSSPMSSLSDFWKPQVGYVVRRKPVNSKSSFHTTFNHPLNS